MIFADRFRGKTMVVTGAAQGIGRGVALRAAAEGAAVMLVDRADFVADVAHEAGRAARALLKKMLLDYSLQLSLIHAWTRLISSQLMSLRRNPSRLTHALDFLCPLAQSQLMDEWARGHKTKRRYAAAWGLSPLPPALSAGPDETADTL